jgi:hypothetical protein
VTLPGDKAEANDARLRDAETTKSDRTTALLPPFVPASDLPAVSGREGLLL